MAALRKLRPSLLLQRTLMYRHRGNAKTQKTHKRNQSTVTWCDDLSRYWKLKISREWWSGVNSRARRSESLSLWWERFELCCFWTPNLADFRRRKCFALGRPLKSPQILTKNAGNCRSIKMYLIIMTYFGNFIIIQSIK